jgi:hypothetical protein
LTGEWEVAATRLQFQHRCSNITRPRLFGVYLRNVFTANNKDYSTLPEIQYYATPAERELSQYVHWWKNEAWALNNKNAMVHFFQKMYFRCVTLPAKYYDSVTSMGNTLCSLIVQAFSEQFPDFKLRYEYNAAEKTARLIPVRAESVQYVVRIVTLSSTYVDDEDVDVMKTLGFTASKTAPITTDLKYEYYGEATSLTLPEISAMSAAELTGYCEIRTENIVQGTLPRMSLISQMLLLYSDIAAFRNVGNIEAQLLDTVVVNSALNKHEDALKGVEPNYVSLFRNSFSSVEIMVTDAAGEMINFSPDASPVIVTLRFRKRN